MNNESLHSELTSLEGTRGQFNVRTGAIKLGIDVHQSFYVVVVQEGGTSPKPAQRLTKEGFLSWAAKLRQKHDPATPIHAVYEACDSPFSPIRVKDRTQWFTTASVGRSTFLTIGATQLQ